MSKIEGRNQWAHLGGLSRTSTWWREVETNFHGLEMPAVGLAARSAQGKEISFHNCSFGGSSQCPLETQETGPKFGGTRGVINTFGECRKLVSFMFYFLNRSTSGRFVFSEQEKISNFPEQCPHLGNPSETWPKFGGSLEETVQWRLTATGQVLGFVARKPAGHSPVLPAISRA